MKSQHERHCVVRRWCACAQHSVLSTPTVMDCLLTPRPLLAGLAGLTALMQPQILDPAVAALGGAAIGAIVEHEHDKHHHQDS